MNHELKDYTGLITRLMAAIETPDDLTQEDKNNLLEDAHIVLEEVEYTGNEQVKFVTNYPKYQSPAGHNTYYPGSPDRDPDCEDGESRSNE